MEALWGSLKSEVYYVSNFPNFTSLKLAIERYIIFYNSARHQENLAGLAPHELPKILSTFKSKPAPFYSNRLIATFPFSFVYFAGAVQ